jgi:hypothetical protein
MLESQLGLLLSVRVLSARMGLLGLLFVPLSLLLLVFSSLLLLSV